MVSCLHIFHLIFFKKLLLLNIVNFLGPNDEFVVSGSDDGNWFVWDKRTGALRNILEGDTSVVNVIEGHPYLPLVAVSGIDTTVKVSDVQNKPFR